MQVLHPLGLADWRSAVQVEMLVLLLKGECTRIEFKHISCNLLLYKISTILEAGCRTLLRYRPKLLAID